MCDTYVTHSLIKVSHRKTSFFQVTAGGIAGKESLVTLMTLLHNVYPYGESTPSLLLAQKWVHTLPRSVTSVSVAKINGIDQAKHTRHIVR